MKIMTASARPIHGYEDSFETRKSLLSRLRDWRDAASWQDFFDLYWRLIYRTARKAGLNDAEAQDVVQETLLTVCRGINDFKYDPKRGSFKGWLLHTTSWRIKDHLRKRQGIDFEPIDEVTHSGQLQESSETCIDVAGEWDTEWEQNLLESAIERVKKKVAPNQFQVFDLTVLKEWPAQRVAETLGMNVAYVYLVKHRVRARVKKEVKKLRQNPCAVSAIALGL